jgi:hypothetical protein
MFADSKLVGVDGLPPDRGLEWRKAGRLDVSPRSACLLRIGEIEYALRRVCVFAMQITVFDRFDGTMRKE